MAVRYEQVFQSSTAGQMPSTAANTVTYGFNAQSGPIEYLIMRNNLTFGDTPTTGSFWQLVNSMRVIVDGEVRFDFRAGIVANDATSPDPLSVLINQIGGRCYENPAGVATREAYCAIPLGMGTTGKNTNTRFEVVIDWIASAAAYASGNLEWWIQYNDNFATGCVVASPTSYVHSANTIETVVVKIPTNIPGAVVAGIYIQNDSLADEFGTQGVRCIQLGSYGLSADFVRMLNGNLANGIMYAGDTVTDQQEFADGLPGALFLPTFGLTNAGEVSLVISSTASTTRTYTPVLTLPSASTQKQTITQSTVAQGNTAKAIVGLTLD